MTKKIQNPDWRWWKFWKPRYSEFEFTASKLVNKHRQIIHFVEGTKRTIENVVYIWENEMTHILVDNGTEWIINKDNVLCVERVPYDRLLDSEQRTNVHVGPPNQYDLRDKNL